MTASAWTADRVERLRTLWTEGRTAEQIAAELGKDISRSAVLGKVYRLGLSDGPRAGVRKPRGGRASAAPAKPQAVALAAPVQSTLAAPVTADLPPTANGLLALGCGHCRWPYGDPWAGMSFCGRPRIRGAYCADHAAVAYRRPPGGAASLMALAGLG